MVREAVEKDVLRINELGLLVNDKFEKVFNIKKILKEDYSKIFVFVENDMIIAFLHITLLYEVIDIINIVVDEKYRRKNVASILFDYLMSEISSVVQLITLEVAVNNTPALKLYEKFGFEIINRRKSYYQGMDAYLLGKRLGE